MIVFDYSNFAEAYYSIICLMIPILKCQAMLNLTIIVNMID